MKTLKVSLVGIIIIFVAGLTIDLSKIQKENDKLASAGRTEEKGNNDGAAISPKPKEADAPPPKGCVFRTVFGEEPSDNMNVYNTPTNVIHAVDHALDWMVNSQQKNGGWGAGTHARQNEMDPLSVNADPATTSMVCMAILRSGSTLDSGQFSKELNKGLIYVLVQVENSDEKSSTITSLTGTQIQVKLGSNIDVVLAAQFLSNVLECPSREEMKVRIEKALQVCVNKIQRAQTSNGSLAGNGWAGVLQSSFATTALESAKHNGARVDDKVLEKSRAYQKGNYDAKTGEANTDMGAGVVLYSVSSSFRNTSVDAKKVKEDVAKAKKEGKLSDTIKTITPQVLGSIGYSTGDADGYYTAYNVYNSAKSKAQQDDVMNGFGSNGGEEFLSYLQTGESMIINKDDDWKKWYDNISGKLISIQNDNGSWSGHHCITSPVFCTATSLLILSVNNDVHKLMKVGTKG